MGRLHDLSRVAPDPIDIGSGIRMKPLMGRPVAEILKNMQQFAKISQGCLIPKRVWNYRKNPGETKTALTAPKNKKEQSKVGGSVWSDYIIY